jgi:hypothetical protein
VTTQTPHCSILSEGVYYDVYIQQQSDDHWTVRYKTREILCYGEGQTRKEAVRNLLDNLNKGDTIPIEKVIEDEDCLFE